MKKLITITSILLLLGCEGKESIKKIERDLTEQYERKLKEINKLTNTNTKIKKIKIFECKEIMKMNKECTAEIIIFSKKYGIEKETKKFEIIKNNEKWTFKRQR